jgi:Hyaluronidase
MEWGMSSKTQSLYARHYHHARWVALSVMVLLSVMLPIRRSEAACFRILDATLYSGKPDLKQYGIEHATLVEPPRWWKTAKVDASGRHDVSVQNGRKLIENPETVIIDLELPVGRTNPAADDNIKQYLDVIAAIRESGYDRPLSFYATIPVRDYWRAQKGPGAPAYRDWQADNDGVAVIVPKVSALYPSLYTFFDDQGGWVRYAEANISEARRIGQGRPVYPFLWPQYHDSAHALAYQYLPRAYWTLQLSTMARVADGLVIWGGWDMKNGKPEPWDDKAPWWQATLDFVKSQRNICTPH